MVCFSEAARRRLHEQFMIAPKRPVFRKANTYRFVDDDSCSGSCLIDVHVGLSSSAGNMLQTVITIAVLLSFMPF